MLVFTDKGKKVDQAVSVVEGTAYLFCNTTATSKSKPPILVIWYKNGGGDPVYSYDLRRKGVKPSARHWADAHALGSRATFHMGAKEKSSSGSKSYLKISNVNSMDRGLFRCRVDFQGSPTRSSLVNLTVIGSFIYVLRITSSRLIPFAFDFSSTKATSNCWWFRPWKGVLLRSLSRRCDGQGVVWSFRR